MDAHPGRPDASGHPDLDRRFRLCGETLDDAEARLAAGAGSALLAQLVHRATDLLDEIDEILLALDVRRQHAAFMRAAYLHRRLADLLAQVPRALRPHLRRALAPQPSTPAAP